MFVMLGVLRGYHEYKDVWNAPNDGALLSFEREPGNPRECYIGCSGDWTESKWWADQG